jgi:NAD-dependent dihydropyrimidine dehydrogenase PreA subunit
VVDVVDHTVGHRQIKISDKQINPASKRDLTDKKEFVMSQQKEIFIRIERCTGCRSCEVACAVESPKPLFPVSGSILNLQKTLIYPCCADIAKMRPVCGLARQGP